MRAAIYLRVSTETQNIANQTPECLALCARRGWTAQLYSEVGSGASQRAVWEQVQADARRGHVGAVVAWSMDRFGRTMHGILDAVREFDSRGIITLTVQEPWLGETFAVPALRTLMISAFSFAAELERERLIERIHRGIHTARVRGQTLGRPRTLDGPALRLLCDLRDSGRTWTEVAAIMLGAGYGRECGNPHRRSSLQTAYNHAKRPAVKGDLNLAFGPDKSGADVDPRQVPLFT